jgi:sugar-specific transcriptional regulator TrmB/DNA-binding CsgD family transcriptional regulator
MLTELGASKEEDLLYSNLVTVVSASREELREVTGLPDDDVDAALTRLIERGLTRRMAGDPPRYVAASPSVVEVMIAGRIAELRLAQSALDQVAAQYRVNSLATGAAGVFEIVRGADELRACVVGMIRSARFELLNMLKPPLIAVRSREQVRPSDSVRGRVIFDSRALDAPDDLAAITQVSGSNTAMRSHTNLPIKLMAVDRAVALVPLAQDDTTPVGVLVRQGALLDALLALFDHVWACAVPLRLDGDGENGGEHEDGAGSPPALLGAEERQLLSMLLAGLTDEAIAAHRGTSVRTVQRKVRSLMAAAHVRTRTQLAWTAAKQGWM